MDKSYIKEPGNYTALIIEATAGKSKKGMDMLTVTFKDITSGGEIRGYFVPHYDFMAKKLAELKLAAGLSPTAKKDDLLGKKVVIGVRMQQVKPGQEKINEKTGKPYPPSTEVFEYIPFREPAQYGDENLPF